MYYCREYILVKTLTRLGNTHPSTAVKQRILSILFFRERCRKFISALYCLGHIDFQKFHVWEQNFRTPTQVLFSANVKICTYKIESILLICSYKVPTSGTFL